MSTSRPLRGGIIGCGFFAQFQIAAWRRMPEVDLVAACDLDIDRAAVVAPTAYASPGAMLDTEKLDFVDIATRPDTHLELVRMTLERRIPTICQKPMAPTWEQCLELAAAAEAARTRLMIHENWRWQPWYRAAKNMISSGDLGEPLSYRFRTCKNDGSGSAPYPDQPYFRHMPRLLIYETIVHHLDTARYLFGEVEAVAATMSRLNTSIAGEDRATILLRHGTSMPGTIDGHRFLDTTPPGPVLGEAWFECERGVLHIAPTGDLFLNSSLVWHNIVREGYRGDSVKATQQHFIDCLQNGRPFESEAAEYLKTVALVEASYLSVATQQWVRPLTSAETGKIYRYRNSCAADGPLLER